MRLNFWRLLRVVFTPSEEGVKTNRPKFRLKSGQIKSNNIQLFWLYARQPERVLKKIKCPEVRKFSRISTKSLFLIASKYSIFIQNYQAKIIRKTRMASQMSGCGFLGIEESRRFLLLDILC